MQIENAGQRSSMKIRTSVNKLWHRESSAVEKSRVSLCTQQKDEAITQDQFAVCGRSRLQFSFFPFFFFWDVRNRFELCVGSKAGCSRSALFLLPLVSVGKGQLVIRSNMVFFLLHNCSFSSFICTIYLRVRPVVFPRSSSSFKHCDAEEHVRLFAVSISAWFALFPFPSISCSGFIHPSPPAPPTTPPPPTNVLSPPTHTSLTKCKAQS